ncbi:hypothetical protein DESA109040_02375 [Deinococcus saxicola]|uniref:hypothetical protein n=1 Tax=Deinococcus saxicola TaxID=249406 RepID=UPI0039F06129
MDKRVLDFLCVYFDRYEDARQLWLASGGRPGLLLETNNARTRWTDALQKIDGGALHYQKFLSEALSTYPGNRVLLQALEGSLTSEQRQALTRLQQTILADGPDGPELVFQEIQQLPTTEAQAAVVTTAAHRAEMENPQASNSFWSKVKDTVATDGVKTLIEAAVNAGVKALKGEV